jgi:hypothetical protein
LEQIELIPNARPLRAFREGSVIRHSPPLPCATTTALCQLLTHRPYITRIPLAAVGTIATVLVMDVSTFTGPGVACWLRQGWRFTGQEPLVTVFLRRVQTTLACLDADGVIGIADAVELHRATG